MQCGLLGRKLGHSYSPQIHKYFGNYPYSLFEVEPDKLETFLKTEKFTGLNVTIPYKKTVVSYCDHLSPAAKMLGSVNTIVRQADGTLIGHNTDYFGFQYMLRSSGLNPAGKKVLVLGSGGASITVTTVLKESGAEPIVISRAGENNYKNLHKHTDAAIIVNATPVGMYPNIEESPLVLEEFPALEGVLDLIYNPARTALLQEAEKRGLIVQNGLKMLVAQAKESAQWFTGTNIPDSMIPTIHNELHRQTENIVLIGMPGCGKSTVGRLLAEKTGKTFVDTDSEIEKAAGKPIPRIFAEDGEEFFRDLEIRILAEFGKSSGLVIATGGGCVTRIENYFPLHCNGKIIRLERALDDLSTEGRPLSQSQNLREMHRLRDPLYRAFADITVENNQSAEQTASAILLLINREDYI